MHVVSALLVVFFIVPSIQDCVMYGECHTDDRGNKQNCRVDDTAKTLQDSEAFNILKKRCQIFFPNGSKYFYSTQRNRIVKFSM